MSLKTYFDFADNDYQYFINSYNSGFVANMMGAMAQGICEKYMKYLIERFYAPCDEFAENDKEDILKTHNLNRLMKFLKSNVGVEFSDETRREMNAINGYYFTARYPGDNSLELDKEDIESCFLAVNNCRTETLDIIKRLDKTIENIILDASLSADKINKDVKSLNVVEKEMG